MPGPGRGGRDMNRFQKPKNIGKTVKRLLQYLMNKKWLLLVVLVFTICGSLAGVVGNYMLKPIINGLIPLIGTNPGAAELSSFIKMLVFLGSVYLLGAAASYLSHLIMVFVTNDVLNTIRGELFDKMQSLSVSYFDTHTHGELMSRYTNDVDTLRNAISQGAMQLISTTISVTATFIMMLVLSPLLTLLIIALMVVMFFAIKIIGKRSAVYFKEQQRALGAANGYIEEMIEGAKVVKVFRYENKANEKFMHLNDELKYASTQANTFGSLLMPINSNLSYINYALVAMLGAARVIGGYMDIGTIAAFLQYSRSFSRPITQLSQIFTSLVSAMAGAERIFDVIDTPAETDNGTVTVARAQQNADGTYSECTDQSGIQVWKQPQADGTYRYEPIKGSVHLDGVHFGYDPKVEVLKDISFYAKPGQKIALVGSTGAGKTTITNLITRFYDINSGVITYDGIDIRDIKKADLRSTLAMVLQDTHLFTGTVRENIRYGRLDATDDEVQEAAKLANADHFITHLPEGYDTMLTADGANLSQGQRQLLAIARAAVADPAVLILDEATSSIDTRTEALIEHGMDKLMHGRTTFVIAHRLSTVRNANAIMVIEHGEIIERGDHDDLIKQKGRYYQLYTGQFEME